MIMAVKRKLKTGGKIVIGVVTALCLALAGIFVFVLNRKPAAVKQTPQASLHEINEVIYEPVAEETTATFFAVGVLPCAAAGRKL